jgi:hypothetical protein
MPEVELEGINLSFRETECIQRSKPCVNENNAHRLLQHSKQLKMVLSFSYVMS